jgi:transcriptional regulator with XRE-family HTH domain
MPPANRPQTLTAMDTAYRAELRSLRLARNWSQADLALVSGYRQSFISNIEQGRQTPRLTVLFDLLAALETPPDDFMSCVMLRARGFLSGD